MRNYRGKMELYRLDPARKKVLRQWCRQPEHRAQVEVVMAETCDVVLGRYILMHVADDWKWAKLEANRIPCSVDTFRVYRAKFYFLLDQALSRANASKGAENNHEEEHLQS